MRAWVVLFGLSGLTACAAGIKTTSFRLNANVDDATVTMDDQPLGTVAFVEKRGVAMPPGRHRLTIEKPGFFPFDRIIEVPEGGADTPIVVEVVLQPIPD